MIQKLSKHILPLTGFLIAFAFTLSLFWCGDPECLSGTSNEDCSALICSLLDKHDTSSAQNSSGGSSNNCTCVCHIPTVTADAFVVRYVPTFQYFTPVVDSDTPSALERLVYRPPIAA
jgi:hypothetical protein